MLQGQLRAMRQSSSEALLEAQGRVAHLEGQLRSARREGSAALLESQARIESLETQNARLAKLSGTASSPGKATSPGKARPKEVPAKRPPPTPTTMQRLSQSVKEAEELERMMVAQREALQKEVATWQAAAGKAAKVAEDWQEKVGVGWIRVRVRIWPAAPRWRTTGRRRCFACSIERCPLL